MAPRRATLDFFAGQASARRRTALLLVAFALSAALVVALVYLGALLPFGLYTGQARLWNGRLLAWVVAGVAAVVALGAGWQAVALGPDGGDAVARRLGAVPLAPDPSYPPARRLRDVLEEMAIASGLPVPRAYVLPDEPGVNAFAAGASSSRAVVVVTRGALEALDRDELQGVVAHELSHVLNLDVRLNGRLMAAVGGLSALALAGRLLIRGVMQGRRRGAAQVSALVLLAGCALVVAGAVGQLCGELLRFAVVREREFLADAAAVQFTRNPAGLAGALRKAAERGSRLRAPGASQVNHFLFANGVVGVLETWFATHPPIAERLRRLEPAGPAAASHQAPPPLESAAAPGPPAAGALVAAGGGPGPAHLAAAGALLAALPPALASAAREPWGARALSCALLLAPPGPTRERQLAGLAAGDGAGATAAEVARLAPLLDGQRGEARVALYDLLSPALDALSAPQARALREELAALAREAGHGAVLPWAFHRALTRRLDRRLAGRAVTPVRYRALSDVEPEALVVLSLLSWAGAREPALAQAALDGATAALGARQRWRLLPRDRLASEGPARALEVLDGASPALKLRVLAACAAAASSDGRVTPQEAALVRAVAASLGCPLPPLVAPAGADAAAGGAAASA
ncbi:M48 family metalloprotease [Anaeromyxobacter diazotrophicus]|uniref:Zn-dependent protease n=1 Tax=Anaeromyxobacter diazotrophicus TaxID=2590199 RepID=A0A7I9VR52_9BACT|nr:M48 family metalloprotease [Anaeromyxobacter diazotrophicus]GEJ58559.1 Zn-dependent protease [Anaeromyxobacter diazotrophicus]